MGARVAREQGRARRGGRGGAVGEMGGLERSFEPAGLQTNFKAVQEVSLQCKLIARKQA